VTALNEVTELRRILDEHLAESKERYARYDEIHEANILAISQLTDDVATLTKGIADLTRSTQGLVDGWVAARAFQRFIKWLSSFAILGIVGVWLYDKFLT